MPLKRITKPTKNNPFGYVNVLKKETATFEKKLDSFMRRHKGKFVLIKGDFVEGFYTERRKALKTGSAKYGHTGSFLVREVCRGPLKTIHMPALTHGLMYTGLNRK